MKESPSTAPAPNAGKPAQSLFEPDRAVGLGLLPEDLPFANEVDAALHRGSNRGARRLCLAIAAFLGVMITWAALAELDEVTHAEGQVTPSQRVQVIQNLEGGIVRAVLVEEGKVVEKDQVLARLDNEFAVSAYRDAIIKTVDHEIGLCRLQAELSGSAPQWPENLETWLYEILGQVNLPEESRQAAHKALASHQSLYRTRYDQAESELRLLHLQWEQRKQEVAEMEKRLENLDRGVELAREQQGIAAQLYRRGSYSRAEMLNAEQLLHQTLTERDALTLALPKARLAEQEAKERMDFRKAEQHAAVAAEMDKRRQELASLKENINAGGDRVSRTELRSPVRGTVKRINITTLGGVLKPGEPIMEIVPLDDDLLIEARVRPADVAFLRPGQQAMVKISAYDFAIFGGLQGTLEQISADTMEDRRGETFYLVKVRTRGSTIEYRQDRLPIIPGMVATVDIFTGKKTVLDYILKPILKARQKALRER